MKATQPDSIANCPINVTGAVLVVDDHRRARESMVDVLSHSGHQVDCCSSGAEALSRIQDTKYDCIVTDLKMPGLSGVELIVQLERLRYGAQIVMVTAHASVASAVEAMRHGAFNYIEKPFGVDELEGLVGQAIQHGRLDSDPSPAAESATMIGSSPAMQALRRRSPKWRLLRKRFSFKVKAAPARSWWPRPSTPPAHDTPKRWSASTVPYSAHN